MKKEELWLISARSAAGPVLRCVSIVAARRAAVAEYTRVREGYDSSVTVELFQLGPALKSSPGTRKLRAKP